MKTYRGSRTSKTLKQGRDILIPDYCRKLPILSDKLLDVRCLLKRGIFCLRNGNTVSNWVVSKESHKPTWLNFGRLVLLKLRVSVEHCGFICLWCNTYLCVSPRCPALQVELFRVSSDVINSSGLSCLTTWRLLPMYPFFQKKSPFNLFME